MNYKVMTRIELLKSMNEHIINIGDEDIYDDWFALGVPDEPSYDDYEFIAENDDEYEAVTKLYHALCAQAEEDE